MNGDGELKRRKMNVEMEMEMGDAYSYDNSI